MCAPCLCIVWTRAHRINSAHSQGSRPLDGIFKNTESYHSLSGFLVRDVSTSLSRSSERGGEEGAVSRLGIVPDLISTGGETEALCELMIS